VDQPICPSPKGSRGEEKNIRKKERGEKRADNKGKNTWEARSQELQSPSKLLSTNGSTDAQSPETGSRIYMESRKKKKKSTTKQGSSKKSL